MKPREMYSGAAPAAMGMMGQGLAEVGANIARTTAQGSQALGQGIGQVGQAIGEAYADYKKMGSEIKASEGFYKSMKEGGYLPENMQTEIDATINSDAFKNSSTADKAAYWNNIKSFSGQSIAHKWSMDKIAAETTGRIQAAGVSTAGQLAERQMQIDAEIAKEKRSREYGIQDRNAKEPLRKTLLNVLGAGTQEAPAAPVSGGVVPAAAAGLPQPDANAKPMTNQLFGGTPAGETPINEGDLSKPGPFDPQAALVDATDSSIFSPAEIRALGKVGHDINSYNALGSLSDKYEVIKKARDLVNQGMAGEPSAQKKTRSR